MLIICLQILGLRSEVMNLEFRKQITHNVLSHLLEKCTHVKLMSEMTKMIDVWVRQTVRELYYFYTP